MSKRVSAASSSSVSPIVRNQQKFIPSVFDLGFVDTDRSGNSIKSQPTPKQPDSPPQQTTSKKPTATVAEPVVLKKNKLTLATEKNREILRRTPFYNLVRLVCECQFEVSVSRKFVDALVEALSRHIHKMYMSDVFVGSCWRGRSNFEGNNFDSRFQAHQFVVSDPDPPESYIISNVTGVEIELDLLAYFVIRRRGVFRMCDPMDIDNTVTYECPPIPEDVMVKLGEMNDSFVEIARTHSLTPTDPAEFLNMLTEIAARLEWYYRTMPLAAALAQRVSYEDVMFAPYRVVNEETYIDPVTAINEGTWTRTNVAIIPLRSQNNRVLVGSGCIPPPRIDAPNEMLFKLNVRGYKLAPNKSRPESKGARGAAKGTKKPTVGGVEPMAMPTASTATAVAAATTKAAAAATTPVVNANADADATEADAEVTPMSKFVTEITRAKWMRLALPLMIREQVGFFGATTTTALPYDPTIIAHIGVRETVATVIDEDKPRFGKHRITDAKTSLIMAMTNADIGKNAQITQEMIVRICCSPNNITERFVNVRSPSTTMTLEAPKETANAKVNSEVIANWPLDGNAWKFDEVSMAGYLAALIDDNSPPQPGYIRVKRLASTTPLVNDIKDAVPGYFAYTRYARHPNVPVWFQCATAVDCLKSTFTHFITPPQTPDQYDSVRNLLAVVMCTITSTLLQGKYEPQSYKNIRGFVTSQADAVYFITKIFGTRVYRVTDDISDTYEFHIAKNSLFINGTSYGLTKLLDKNWRGSNGRDASLALMRRLFMHATLMWLKSDNNPHTTILKYTDELQIEIRDNVMARRADIIGLLLRFDLIIDALVKKAETTTTPFEMAIITEYVKHLMYTNAMISHVTPPIVTKTLVEMLNDGIYAHPGALGPRRNDAYAVLIGPLSNDVDTGDTEGDDAAQVDAPTAMDDEEDDAA